MSTKSRGGRRGRGSSSSESDSSSSTAGQSKHGKSVRACRPDSWALYSRERSPTRTIRTIAPSAYPLVASQTAAVTLTTTRPHHAAHGGSPRTGARRSSSCTQSEAAQAAAGPAGSADCNIAVDHWRGRCIERPANEMKGSAMRGTSLGRRGSVACGGRDGRGAARGGTRGPAQGATRDAGSAIAGKGRGPGAPSAEDPTATSEAVPPTPAEAAALKKAVGEAFTPGIAPVSARFKKCSDMLSAMEPAQLAAVEKLRRDGAPTAVVVLFSDANTQALDRPEVAPTPESFRKTRAHVSAAQASAALAVDSAVAAAAALTDILSPSPTAKQAESTGGGSAWSEAGSKALCADGGSPDGDRAGVGRPGPVCLETELTPKGDELYLLKDGPDRAPLSALLVNQTIAQQCGPASFRAGTKHKAHGVPFQPGDRVIPQGALVHRFPRLCTVIALGDFVVGGYVRVAFDAPVIDAGKTFLGLGASPDDFALVYRPGEEPDAAKIEELTAYVDRLKEATDIGASAAGLKKAVGAVEGREPVQRCAEHKRQAYPVGL